MARSLKSLLESIGAHNKEAVGPTGAEAQPMVAGVSDAVVDNAPSMTKVEAAEVRPERSAWEDTYAQVYGEDAPTSGQNEEAGKPKRKAVFTPSPTEQANTSVRGNFTGVSPLLTRDFENLKTKGPAQRANATRMGQSQDLANSLLSSLNEISNPAPTASSIIGGRTSQKGRTDSKGKKLRQGEGEGAAHDSWDNAYRFGTALKNYFETLPRSIGAASGSKISGLNSVQSQADTAFASGKLSKSHYNFVTSEIGKHKTAAEASARFLAGQGNTSSLREQLLGHNRIIDALAALNQLKRPDGGFKTMDPNVLHKKIQNPLGIIYGVHKFINSSALAAVGLKSPVHDKEASRVVSLASKLDTSKSLPSNAKLPRDAHPDLSEHDSEGNIINPKVALAPHDTVWVSSDIMGGMKKLASGKKVPKGSNYTAEKLTDDLLTMLNRDYPSHPDTSRANQLANYADNGTAPQTKFYNYDGTVHIPHRGFVPAPAGSPKADRQAMAKMTPSEKAAYQIRSGTHVYLNTDVLTPENLRIPGSPRSGVPIKVSASNLIRLQRRLGADHADTITMDNALRSLQGKPSREEEAEKQATLQAAYEAQVDKPTPPAKVKQPGIIDLPTSGTSDRTLPGALAFMLHEAHDHIVQGTATGVPGRGVIPLDLSRAIGKSGKIAVAQAADKTMRGEDGKADLSALASKMEDEETQTRLDAGAAGAVTRGLQRGIAQPIRDSSIGVVHMRKGRLYDREPMPDLPPRATFPADVEEVISHAVKNPTLSTRSGTPAAPAPLELSTGTYGDNPFSTRKTGSQQAQDHLANLVGTTRETIANEVARRYSEQSYYDRSSDAEKAKMDSLPTEARSRYIQNGLSANPERGL